MTLLDLALLLCPREFRAGYRRDFGAAQTLDAFDVARTGVALRVESIVRDTVLAARSLRRAPLFTFVSLLTLALAISVNAVVFGAIEATLLRPLPFVQPDRLAFLCSGNARNCSQMPNALIGEYQRRLRGMGEIAAWQYMSAALTGFGPPRSVNIGWTSANFFEVMRVRPELGRTFAAHDAQPGVRNLLISDALWRNQFNADPHAIGRVLHLDGAAWRIVGVTAAALQWPDWGDSPGANTYDVFEPLPSASFAYPNGNPHLNDLTIMRLAPGVSIAAVQQNLNRVTAAMKRAHPELKKFVVTAVPFTAYYHAHARNLLYLALAAVFAVLLIACANIANLLLARGMARSGELATRSALGAGRRRILQQLGTEIVLLACGGGLAGLALSWGELRLLAGLDAASVLPGIGHAHIDAAVIGFVFGIVAFASIVAGLIPAFILLRRDIQSKLKGAGRNADAGAGNAMRTALAVAEVALAFAVIVSSGLLYRSFVDLSSEPLGYNADHVYVATAVLFAPRFGPDAARVRFITDVQQRVAAIPGVTAAAVARPVPVTGMGAEGYLYRLPGRTYTDANTPGTVITAVTPDYFKALSIPLLQGRAFSARDRSGAARVAVVERRFAETAFPGKTAIGKQILLPSGNMWVPATIVGTVGDANQFDEFGNIPTMYVPAAQWPMQIAQIVIQTNGRIPNLRSDVARAVAAVDPLQAVQSFHSLQERVDGVIAPTRTTAALVGILAALALLLALAGIFAIVSYSVEQRRHEFGIRVALGGLPGTIVRLVLSGALRLAVFGVLLGIALSAVAAHLLGALLVHVSPFDPITFVAVILLVLVSVAVASVVPALQAAGLHPTEALRYE